MWKNLHACKAWGNFYPKSLDFWYENNTPRLTLYKYVFTWNINFKATTIEMHTNWHNFISYEYNYQHFMRLFSLDYQYFQITTCGNISSFSMSALKSKLSLASSEPSFFWSRQKDIAVATIKGLDWCHQTHKTTAQYPGCYARNIISSVWFLH